MFSRVFLDHPRSVDESYFAHLRFALKFSFRLILAGLAALIHGIFPCAFERTASQTVRQLAELCVGRGR